MKLMEMLVDLLKGGHFGYLVPSRRSKFEVLIHLDEFYIRRWNKAEKFLKSLKNYLLAIL